MKEKKLWIYLIMLAAVLLLGAMGGNKLEVAAPTVSADIVTFAE